MMFSGFMVDAWIAGSIVAVTAGVVGFFVVLRGASFAAHALPLSGFPGAALAVWLGIDPLVGLVMFGLMGVVGIGALSRHGRPEVATALTLVMLLGLGTLFLSRTRQYGQAVYALLFGQVLGVGRADLVPVAVVGVVAVAAVLVLFRPLLLNALSADMAGALGVAPGWMDAGFLVILALASSVALPVVGALLVFSLMVGPASCARSLSSRPERAMAISVAIALGTVWASIALSYASDWPVGFFVGGFGAVAYAVGLAAAQVAHRPLTSTMLPPG